MLSQLRYNHGETIDMLRESVAAFAAAPFVAVLFQQGMR